MKQAVVSIALCTYQGKKFLAEQLDSLVEQTYPHLEIVVCDDHSTDGTWEILQDYQGRYPHLFRIIRNPIRLGFQANFQKVFQSCQGELIAPCDQDDRWHPEKISKMVPFLGSNQLVYHDSLLMDEGGKSLGKRISEKIRFFKGKDPAAFLLFNCVSGHSMLFRKELLEQSLPFPPIGYYDHWLAFRANQLGTVDYLKETLVYFRQHGRNLSDFSRSHKKSSKSYQSIKRKMQLENDWLQWCIQSSESIGETSPEHQISQLGRRREQCFFLPALGLKIWNHRNRILRLSHASPIHQFFISLRYCWGLKGKKLLYKSL